MYVIENRIAWAHKATVVKRAKPSLKIFLSGKGFSNMSQGGLLDVPFRPMSQSVPSQLSLPMLKSWLSSYGYPSTTAGPIVATTITIEAIQDLLHANGYPIEAPCHTDFCSGPFEDTQFDAVVDVETSDEDSMDTDLKLSDLDACSEYGYCGSDLSDDEINFFQDLPLSPDSPLLSDSADLDFGCDSGIEAEMDEPHDGSENKNEKKEKSKDSSDEKKSTEDSGKEGNASNQPSASRPQKKDSKPEDKESGKAEEGTEDEEEIDDDNIDSSEDKEDDLPHIHCQYLWEFLHRILLEKQNKYIEWKNQTKGVFRLIDHNGLAKLWGRQKNRKNMTYEKLSRALRYYYSKNILRKVPGQRLTYKFVRNLDGKKYPL